MCGMSRWLWQVISCKWLHVSLSPVLTQLLSTCAGVRYPCSPSTPRSPTSLWESTWRYVNVEGKKDNCALSVKLKLEMLLMLTFAAISLLSLIRAHLETFGERWQLRWRLGLWCYRCVWLCEQSLEILLFAEVLGIWNTGIFLWVSKRCQMSILMTYS